jgi:hypothetical protein
MSESRGDRRKNLTPDAVKKQGLTPETAMSGDWLNDIRPDGMSGWEHLPDIGLYMDQVLTFVERQLAMYRRGDDDRLVTAAMVNNYIKDGLVPRAESKKYAPPHLALLLMIGTLKQVLSIPDIKRMISADIGPSSVEKLYGRFLELQRAALRDTTDLVRRAGLPDRDTDPAEGRERLRRLALELVVEARTRVLASQRVLDMLDQMDQVWTANSEDLRRGRKDREPESLGTN